MGVNRGAEYRRVDFQMHSPRDRGWSGEGPLGEKHTRAEKVEEQRTEWASDFVDTCLERGLRAVAITDHHEAVMVWYVVREVESRRAIDGECDLWVFPGIELTCADRAQALLIFDADITPGQVERARGKLNLPIECNILDAKGIAVELLQCNLNDLQAILSDDEELAGRFIIIPHAGENGHKTVLARQFHARFRKMPYFGCYSDGQHFSELSSPQQKKLNGEDPAWGDQRRVLICTSDNRSAGYEALGEACSWLKLAEPTAESIRQAFLAPDSRWSEAEPDLPSLVLDWIEVDGSIVLEAQRLHFNSQMNSLIGGRGAGKSTLLEYIRFALGRSAWDENYDEPSDETVERRAKLLTRTLQNEARVRLCLQYGGTAILLERTKSRHQSIDYTVGGITKSLSPEGVQQEIEVQAYSQGELSSLGAQGAKQRLLDLLIATVV